WPWSPDKTIAGTIAFIVAGGAAGTGLALWCRPPDIPAMFALIAVPLAAVAAAMVETIPIKLDDNLSVALSAGATLWLGALVCDRHAAALDLLAPQGSYYQT